MSGGSASLLAPPPDPTRELLVTAHSCVGTKEEEEESLHGIIHKYVYHRQNILVQYMYIHRCI